MALGRAIFVFGFCMGNEEKPNLHPVGVQKIKISCEICTF